MRVVAVRHYYLLFIIIYILICWLGLGEFIVPPCAEEGNSHKVKSTKMRKVDATCSNKVKRVVLLFVPVGTKRTSLLNRSSVWGQTSGQRDRGLLSPTATGIVNSLQKPWALPRTTQVGRSTSLVLVHHAWSPPLLSDNTVCSCRPTYRPSLLHCVPEKRDQQFFVHYYLSRYISLIFGTRVFDNWGNQK